MTMAEENNNNKWAQFEEVHQSPGFQYPAVRCDRDRWTLVDISLDISLDISPDTLQDKYKTAIVISRVIVH